MHWLFIVVMSFASLVQAAESDDKHLFNEHLCLQVKFYQGQPLEDLAVVKQLGVKWVREEDKWHEIEVVQGQYKPLSASLKRRLAFYKQHDIGVIFILAYENPVAYPNTKTQPFNFVNVAGFAAYAEYMAKQLKASGVRFALELWNEPHNSQFAQSAYLGGQWQGAPESPWLDHYVKMVNAAVLKIKAVDPAISVITNDDMWIVHYHFLNKGLSPLIDGFGVHPYSGGRPPEIAAVAYNANWTKPYQVVDKDQSFESAVSRLKDYGAVKLGKKPSIWITEWGWRVGEQSPTGDTLDEAKIASYLPRAFILAKAAGVKTTCWFSAQDIGDGPMGLKTNEGRYRPAFNAFLALSKTLGHTQYVCELKQGDQKKRAFLFKDAKNWIVADWSTADSQKNNRVRYSKMHISDDMPSCN